MKTVLVMSVLVALAAASVEEEKFQEECKEEAGVSMSSVLGYLKDDDSSNDEKAIKFMLCYFKKKEVIDDDGHLDVEKATALTKSYMKEAGIDTDHEVLNCIKQKDTAEDTVLSIGKCVEKRIAELKESK